MVATPIQIRLLGVEAYGLIGLIAVNVGCLVMNLCQAGSFWFIWVSPAVLVLYALHMRQSPSYNALRAAAPRAEAAVAVPV